MAIGDRSDLVGVQRAAEELPPDMQGRVNRVTEMIEIMMARSKNERPFLIVTDMETGRSVQFAGSKEEALLLDVPAHEYSKRFHYVTIETVVKNAFEMLSRQLHGSTNKNRWIADMQWTVPCGAEHCLGCCGCAFCRALAENLAPKHRVCVGERVSDVRRGADEKENGK